MLSPSEQTWKPNQKYDECCNSSGKELLADNKLIY